MDVIVALFISPMKWPDEVETAGIVQRGDYYECTSLTHTTVQVPRDSAPLNLHPSCRDLPRHGPQQADLPLTAAGTFENAIM